MRAADLAVLLFLTVLVCSAIRYMKRLKREGKGCCGCADCSACSKGRGHCQAEHED